MDLGSVISYLLVLAIAAVVVYFVIRTAVLHALTSHYKSARHYEKTGEWEPGYNGTREPKSYSE